VVGSFWYSLKYITVATSGGILAKDEQIMTRLNVSATVEEGEDRQNGYFGGGGRIGFDHFENFTPEMVAQEAVRQAVVNLDAAEAPAGMQTVVLGNGWAGILLHEAIGHGLEADFNRKKTSLYSDRIGEKVASDGVTVIDEGIIPNRRGSISIDDEGEPTRKNVLIEDGILKGYMCDLLNAKLMGMEPTGNGRRESFKHYPMPRMTNTYMLPGRYDPQEIIESVGSGFYAKSFGGGQVDISNGNFVFQVTEGYLIENGRITSPVKGANLIGVGPDVLSKVEMIGNDLEFDSGIGTCGKNGQSVPVGVGMPTAKISSITVGGTAVKGRSLTGNT
jgi:TldD protein